MKLHEDSILLLTAANALDFSQKLNSRQLLFTDSDCTLNNPVLYIYTVLASNSHVLSQITSAAHLSETCYNLLGPIVAHEEKCITHFSEKS